MEKLSCERCKKEYSKVEMYKVNSLFRDSKEYICKECLEYVCSVCGKFSSVMPKEINDWGDKVCSQCISNSPDIIE